MRIRLSDYDYSLPEELIAQHALPERDASRMMVLGAGVPESRSVRDLPEYLKEGDLVVVNDTRVISARLIGRRPTGGEAEVFLLRRQSDRTWEALVRPSKRLSPGSRVLFDGGASVEIREDLGSGKRVVFLEGEETEDALIDKHGKVPLPPYIRRPKSGPSLAEDRDRYQTVYAREEGAVAAPTAGLHFSSGLIREIEKRGSRFAEVTLHVGAGTFRPLSEQDLASDRLHPEWYRVSASTASVINETRERGNRVLVVGTTAARALESSACRDGRVQEAEGWTDLFIRFPYRFRVVENLLTNFHLPRSSLLMLVSALAGRDRILSAYERAVKEGYRFYSYGDAMLILGENSKH